MGNTAVKSVWAICLGAALFVPAVALAGPPPAPGECANGACGTPKDNGGGCGCGCGGSILVNNTDIGNTYSTSDDYDGDGIVDDFDNCPFIPNRDQADSDGDGVGNACDNCVAVANKDQGDINGNHIGDVCDPDMDGDGIANGMDNCAKVPNVGQGDINKNGIGDACDPDMDGDGIANNTDNCPRVYNPDQSKTAPGMYGSACDDDTDKDGIEDSKDNCPTIFNPDQSDINANGIGDKCDADADGDKIMNMVDNCPLVSNPDQKDSDHDGIGDACSSRFCFVASTNRAATCLDPTATFQVTAAPAVQATTGDQVFLSIFANRQNVGIRYTWAITSAPDGSTDTVSNSVGVVSTSDTYEYHYNSESVRPILVPRLPGSYTLTLTADLIQPDPLFPTAPHAEGTVTLDVTGSPMAGGCQIGNTKSGSFAVLGLVFAALAGLMIRRKRFSL